MPPLALAFGWRTAVAFAAAVVGALALLTWALYRDLPEPAAAGPAPERTGFWTVMRNRDLWLVGVSTLIFAGVQTVFLSFLVLYLRDAVQIALVVAAKYLVAAQCGGVAGRIGFGLLSDRLFGGRLVPLAASIGFFGVGWNGVQHTLMAELAGARAAGTAVGLGLAISSLGVTVCPPIFVLIPVRERTLATS